MIVLKRRDNVPFKDVYGGIIDILMKEDVNKAVQFTQECLGKIVDKYLWIN